MRLISKNTTVFSVIKVRNNLIKHNHHILHDLFK